MDRYLVVGCDGLIGNALGKHLEDLPAVVYRTTRRACTVGASFALDLTDFSRDPNATDDLERLAQTGPLTAFLAAAVTGYDQCENDPAGSRRVNVTNTCLLAERLFAHGAFVVFLSSSAVFSGDHAVTEDSVSDPRSEYGRQKADAEARLIEAGWRQSIGTGVAIVRISKVLAPNTPIINSWRDSLCRGENIYPFLDLRISPVSLSYVVDGLVELGVGRQNGVFHLSGERDVTYADLARELAVVWGYSSGRVRPVTIAEAGICSSCAPKYPSLGMARTTQATGLSPQSFESCIAAVAKVVA